MDKFTQTFKEEAIELLQQLEESLLELESNQDDMNIIDKVFRAIHSVKGSAGMFGFTQISDFTHEIETVLDLARNGEIQVSNTLIDLVLQARDIILAMLDPECVSEGIEERVTSQIIQQLKAMHPESEKDLNEDTAEVIPEPVPVEPAPKTEMTSAKGVYWIRFKPEKDIFHSGTNPLNLLTELSMLGKSEIISHLDNVPDINTYNTDACYFWWDILLITSEDINTIKDVFMFVEDRCELKIEKLSINEEMTNNFNFKAFTSIFSRESEFGPLDLLAFLEEAQEDSLDDILLTDTEDEHGEASIHDIKNRLLKTTPALTSVRVPAKKLDKMVDLVGELIVAQAHLSQMASRNDNLELSTISETFDRLCGDLRDNTMSLRMLPIGTTFEKFKRVVRDLSLELKKSVKLKLLGTDTELDKNMIEKLNDPLVHIIRNSMDHGIELPEERERAGKNNSGIIQLAARQAGANIVIEISDDGAGLDAEAIRRKAIENGLLKPETELSENEIFQLIFTPGFSTARNVTNVSGRGVGMDVVRRNIEELKGSIDIASQKGEGTTITINLPLTLAIIEGLLVRIAEDFFILPLAVVSECVELLQKQGNNSSRRNLINVRGELVPYISLREFFAIDGQPPVISQIVLIEIENSKIGIAVDDVIGEYQTVIKSLGRVYRHIYGLSGATILGDGNVALILDLPAIIQQAAKEESLLIEELEASF
ncbi:chemotaxis protein CheA [candidate division KSB1 bacterium]|nr:chemotaxis protein CheA [candidate division KSB1 bacterium]